MPKILIALFLFIIPFQSRSQILPKEGSSLNYRLIGFSFPTEPSSKYTIEIAAGSYSATGLFAKNIIRTVAGKSNKIIAEVPAFGKSYTWRIVYTGKKGKESALHHFSTKMNTYVDTNMFRLRILQHSAEQYKDNYVLVDGGGVLYDMKGQAVWYVPDTNGYNGSVADIKFTPQGTITFIYRNAYEINYNGDVLWKAPNNGAVGGDTAHGEFYHHEFMRLPNGHYMLLGMQLLMCKAVSSKDTSYIIVSKGKDYETAEKNGYKQGRFGTIIEYDKKGNVVWSWRSSDHLIGSDFDYANSINSNIRFDPHDNAFYFDEKNSAVYLGYKFLNRIVKIDYPSGKILRIYGENFKPGSPETGNGLFCNQHSIGRTQDGYLYYFNNNSCNNTDSLPTVVMLQEPLLAMDTLKKVWEYTCTMDGIHPQIFGNGGNAIELPDKSVFINMGSGYSKLFIVNREKKVFWSALPERYMQSEERWSPMHEYRATIINRKELERAIWNAETFKSSL